MTEAERKAWNEAIEAAARMVHALPSEVYIDRTLIGTRQRMPHDYARAVRLLAEPEPTK